jgi:hypothetical protein
MRHARATLIFPEMVLIASTSMAVLPGCMQICKTMNANLAAPVGCRLQVLLSVLRVTLEPLLSLMLPLVRNAKQERFLPMLLLFALLVVLASTHQSMPPYVRLASSAKSIFLHLRDVSHAPLVIGALPQWTFFFAAMALTVKLVLSRVSLVPQVTSVSTG